MPNPTDRLDRYDGYLQQDPDNTTLAVEAFELALSLGLHGRAAGYLDRAQAVAGADPYLQYRRASLWAAQGRWDEALELQSDLCRRLPQDQDLRVALANLLHYAGRHEEAEAAWSALQQSGNLPAHAWANRLRTLHFLGRLEGGLALGETYAEELKSHPEAAGVLSLIAIDCGRFDVARHWAGVALGSLPDSTEALTSAGALALAAKDAAGAIAALTRVVQSKPQEGRAWSSLGIAHLLVQDGATAQADFQRATALMPGHVGSWHGLGWACLLLGNLAQAKVAFEQALALDRNFGESHGAVAVVYALTGQSEDAARHIDLALRLDSAALSARFAQAALSGALQRPEEFQTLAARALRGVEAPDGRSLIDWIRQ
ncbi:tetratricopeptide repeat protein [Achromobacter deleyi]|uniref:tetratricopeptide repeat protein n=1 Tax=Achromobacter deleyi TaxID=1353891 RepID=UPI001490A8C7|nr:tetratricopeptide repeat protein [Achromobacter deleyi]QVQ26156.1 tetratricopeptide repeat protein [Achromobacter deleyi]UIP21718.1 tetratricopeptide repeat protein [Achromobacter deleyi]